MIISISNSLRAAFVWPLLVCALLLLPSSEVKAQDAEITDVIVTNSATDLLVFFNIRNAFSPELEKAVQNGLPATFVFEVKLQRIRKGWTDPVEVTATFEHSLSFDTLKEEYQVVHTGNGVRSETVVSLARARKLMTEVKGYKVVPLSRLLPDNEYELHIKARLAKKNIPFNFSSFIPFWGSSWNFDTDWYTARFRY